MRTIPEANKLFSKEEKQDVRFCSAFPCQRFPSSPSLFSALAPPRKIGSSSHNNENTSREEKKKKVSIYL
jgi:hypothetical protein